MEILKAYDTSPSESDGYAFSFARINPFRPIREQGHPCDVFRIQFHEGDPACEDQSLHGLARLGSPQLPTGYRSDVPRK